MGLFDIVKKKEKNLDSDTNPEGLTNVLEVYNNLRLKRIENRKNQVKDCNELLSVLQDLSEQDYPESTIKIFYRLREFVENTRNLLDIDISTYKQDIELNNHVIDFIKNNQ